MTPVRKLQLLFAGCAMAASALVAREGWVERVYPDPVHGNKIPTGCAGVTKGMKPGQVFTTDECVEKTAAAMVEHFAPILPCVPENIPVGVFAVFGNMSYNLKGGPTAFCKSSMSKRAMAGDFKGACDAILLYHYAGGLDCRTDWRCRGLWLNRQKEHAQCLKGLS